MNRKHTSDFRRRGAAPTSSGGHLFRTTTAFAGTSRVYRASETLCRECGWNRVRRRWPRQRFTPSRGRDGSRGRREQASCRRVRIRKRHLDHGSTRVGTFWASGLRRRGGVARAAGASAPRWSGSAARPRRRDFHAPGRSGSRRARGAAIENGVRIGAIDTPDGARS